jgi:hypothetical protein
MDNGGQVATTTDLYLLNYTENWHNRGFVATAEATAGMGQRWSTFNQNCHFKCVTDRVTRDVTPFRKGPRSSGKEMTDDAIRFKT